MSRVLFVTWDGGGNVPPALEIAAELRHRGDTVRFLGHPSQRDAIESHGFAFEAYRHARPWSVLKPRSGPTAPLAYAAVFTDKGMGTDLLESVAREPADHVVVDGLLIGAMASARRARLHYSILVHTLYGVMSDTLNRGPLALIMRAKGLNPRRLYADAEHVIVTALETLDPATAASTSPPVSYTGPTVSAVQPTAARLEDAHPIILVSLSTTYIDGQLEALQAILDAVEGLPVRAVVTTGPAVDPAGLNAPANAEVHLFLPHAEWMPSASIVIGHGGHATTMLALAHGLPLLIMPMNTTFDQPTIGRMVAERGAGRVLKKTATSAEIRTAVEQLLSPGPHNAAAGELGEQIRARRSAAVAADLLGGIAH